MQNPISGAWYMSTEIIDNIPFQLDLALLQDKLRVKKDSSYWGRLQSIVAEAQAIAQPKALYKVALVDEKGDDFVVLDGVRFSSRILRVNLDPAQRVFPYAATCGTELHDWADSLDDILERYWADVICELALRAAGEALATRLAARYQPGQTASMNPGSLGDWPLKEQRALFQLLGNPEQAIGVRLLQSCLMVPSKSVSGIQFPTEEGFANCQLCPRVDCPGRRAPYDPELYDRKYKPGTPDMP